MVDFILDELSAGIAMVLIAYSSDPQPSGPGPVSVRVPFGRTQRLNKNVLCITRNLQVFYFENRSSRSRDTVV